MEDYFTFTERLFDRGEVRDKPEALAGIRVLDLTHVIFGPYSTGLLGRFGAEVIKVELPFYGDFFRTATYWGRYWKHSSPIEHFLHQNKYFVAIDIKLPKGKALVRRLAEISDVVVENFAPGTMESWGVGYTELSKVNPKIVYLSCSTYGQYGPLRFFPGWDLLAQAASGTISLTGHPDTDKYYKLPDYLGDFIPAHVGALSILNALYHRQKTGKGQYIDLAQSECLMRILWNYSYFSVTGEEIGRTGNTDPTMSPSGIFKTRDGKFVALVAGTDGQFAALAEAMGREDLVAHDDYRDTISRLKPENRDRLNCLVAEWVATRDATEIVRLGGELAFPAAQVVDDLEICSDDWRQARGSVVLFDDEMYGKLAIPGPPAMLSKTPGRTKWLLRPVGYHNRYVFRRLLKLSEDEIQRLEKDRVVGYWDDRPGLKPPVYYDMQADSVFNYRGDEKEE